MNWSMLFSRLFDPYDLKARLLPGLLLLMPVLVFFAVVIGPKDPLLVALGSVIATCGGPYFLASFVRSWGLRAQRRLYGKWGGQPSSILLRHGDRKLSTQTKQAYHKLIEKKLGVKMPTEQNEQSNPRLADTAYDAAANALRPLTADAKKFPFIFKELVSYGYNRNSFGCRWVGFFICLATILVTIIHGSAVVLPSSNLNFKVLAELDFQHVLVLVTAAILLLVWLFHFTAKTVEQAGFSYATRLWEALNKVPSKTTGKAVTPPQSAT